MKNRSSRLAFGALLLGLSGTAAAHNGIHASGVLSGLVHPLTGPDHLLAIVLVGVLAATLGRGAKALALPVAFVSAMIGGAVLAATGIELPLLETVIGASVLTLGIVLSANFRPTLAVAAAATAAFGLFHGNAHGLEMGAAGATHYALGYVATTLVLHLMGMGVGQRLAAHPRAMQAVGALSGIVGTSLMLGA